MESKSLTLFLVICSILLASASVEASAALGGRKASSFDSWQAVDNLTDPKVVEIAEFAVKEYNKWSYSILGLVSIVKGETQMVDGKNYRLIILVRDGLMATAAAAESIYRVVVWDKPWMKDRRVTLFEKIA